MPHVFDVSGNQKIRVVPIASRLVHPWQFPAWKNNLFVGALNGQQLQRIAFNQPSQAERREPLLSQLRIRVRDVQQGPDGNIYVATEKRTGGADPDGTVLRIEPAH